MAAAAVLYADLDAERRRLLDRLVDLPVFEPDEIRRAAEARVLGLREGLEPGPDTRVVLRCLLGNGRLRGRSVQPLRRMLPPRKPRPWSAPRQVAAQHDALA